MGLELGIEFLADQIGELVRVLYRSWHLHTAYPVVIHEALFESEILDILHDVRILLVVIVEDMEVAGSGDTLSGLLTD